MRGKYTVLFLLCQQLLACSTPQVQVDTTLGGQQLQTTLDAPLARYYAEEYRQGRREQAGWDASLDAMSGQPGLPTPLQLQEIAAQSPDLASLFLAERLLKGPENRAVQAAFDKAFLQLQAEGVDAARSLAGRLRVLFVPGWVYQSFPQTGADFALQRRLLDSIGVPNALLPVAENGQVEDNATIIVDQLRRYARLPEPIVLVSTSKGGPETALALSLLAREPAAQAVRGWVNVGGLLRGTHLADKAATWPWSWLAAWFVFGELSPDGVASLQTARSKARWAQLQLPAHIDIVSYLALPMSGQIRDDASTGYRLLKKLGPNDGLTLITDALPGRGPVLLALGLDHYFRHPQIAYKTLALTLLMAERLNLGGE